MKKVNETTAGVASFRENGRDAVFTGCGAGDKTARMPFLRDVVVILV
jgi:hypothetical protein